MRTFLFRKVPRLAVALLLLASTARSQQPANPPVPVIPRLPGLRTPPQSAGADAAAPAVPSESGERLISLKFSDTPLEMVLDRYAEFTGRTVLIAPGLKANITLRIEKRITIPEAIEAIEAVLAMNNIALVREGERFVKAVQINTARFEGHAIRAGEAVPDEVRDYLITEIIPLKHLELADAQSAIATVVHPYANVQALPRINSLFVTDTATNIERVKQLLALLDQPIEMKEELFIIQIHHAKASDIRARLSEIIAETVAQQQSRPATTVRPAVSGPPGVIRATTTPVLRAPSPTTPPPESDTSSRDLIRGPVKLVADDRANILIIVTRPENMAFFNKIVEAIDVGVEPDIIVKVFRLEHADAGEVEGMLNKLIGAAGQPPAAGGAPPSLRDRPRESGEGERATELSEYVRLLQEARAAAQERTEKSKLGELSAQNVKILSDKRSNAVIVMASKSDMAAIEEIIHDMDIMLSQVLIEAVILSVTLTKDSETGVDWLQRSMTAYRQEAGGGRRAIAAFTGGSALSGVTPISALNTPSSIPGTLSYFLTFFDLNLDAVIKLSASDNRARIISSPVILTTDNKPAEIEISKDAYFYKGQKPVSAGSTIEYVEDVEVRKVGTKLTVTPRINKNKFVVMDIKQVIEEIAESQSIPNRGQWPIASTRSMNATIAVNSGETIMLGGLSKKSDRAGGLKIPFFGDIPLLGALFRQRVRQDAREEIMVFITPYVLDTPEEIRADAERRRRAADLGGIWKRGWSASRLADPSDEELRLQRIQARLERGGRENPSPSPPPESEPSSPSP
jgi:general secretion pathway protein D